MESRNSESEVYTGDQTETKKHDDTTAILDTIPCDPCPHLSSHASNHNIIPS